eukprot:2860058-Rhodomonas_salina.1
MKSVTLASPSWIGIRTDPLPMCVWSNTQPTSLELNVRCIPLMTKHAWTLVPTPASLRPQTSSSAMRAAPPASAASQARQSNAR